MNQVIILVILVLEVILVKGDSPQVYLKQGVILGRRLETRDGASFHAFTGIPYAKPPVGELRFKEPVPAKPWRGTLNATKRHPVCPQYSLKNNKVIIGKEDCLFLNVYTPYQFLESQNRLAVMVFIHGGGFSSGSGRIDNYGPEYFMNKDVILVTFNYRLGILGFLTTGDAVVPGNNGLKDQVLAIQWVKDNIAHFGGNSNQITVFGQQAGAVSAHFQMLYSATNDFIKGVIAQSGTGFVPHSVVSGDSIKNYTYSVASSLACPTRNTEEMINCLKIPEVNMIVELAKRLQEENLLDAMPFRPVVEPNVQGAFLTCGPNELLDLERFENISFMTGINTHEGDSFMVLLDRQEVVRKLLVDFTEHAPTYLQYRRTINSTFLNQASINIKKFYFPDGEITDFGISRIYTDLQFLTGADAAIEFHANLSKQHVYYYLFGYKGSTSYCSSDYYGVCHSDELLYLFNNAMLFPNYKPTPSDNVVTKLMITLWTNFAKYGNPTPANVEQEAIERWEPFTKETKYFYLIKRDGTSKVGQNMLKQRAEFWKNILTESDLGDKEEL